MLKFVAGLRDDPDQRGVIPNSFQHIFNHIGRSENQQFLIRASYLEIYLEEIRYCNSYFLFIIIISIPPASFL